MSIEIELQEEARLAILKELSKEENKAISSSRMQSILLARLLIDKPREWIELQYSYLRDMQAVTIVEADTVKIARLTARGEHHLKGIIQIAGVMVPTIRG